MEIDNIELYDLIGYEGLYKISKCGKIYSIRRSGAKGGWLKELMGKEYKYFRVSINGKVKDKTSHRLLALNFIPNPNNKPQVNHKDGDKLNNDLSNLEWATNKENIQHSILNGLKDVSFNFGEKSYLSKLTNLQVVDIKQRLFNGEKGIVLALEYNVSQQIICDIKKGRKWKSIVI